MHTHMYTHTCIHKYKHMQLIDAHITWLRGSGDGVSSAQLGTNQIGSSGGGVAHWHTIHARTPPTHVWMHIHTNTHTLTEAVAADTHISHDQSPFTYINRLRGSGGVGSSAQLGTNQIASRCGDIARRVSEGTHRQQHSHQVLSQRDEWQSKQVSWNIHEPRAGRRQV